MSIRSVQSLNTMDGSTMSVHFNASAGVDVPRPLRPPEETPRVRVRFILIMGRGGRKAEELANTLPERWTIIVMCSRIRIPSRLRNADLARILCNHLWRNYDLWCGVVFAMATMAFSIVFVVSPIPVTVMASVSTLAAMFAVSVPVPVMGVITAAVMVVVTVSVMVVPVMVVVTVSVMVVVTVPIMVVVIVIIVPGSMAKMTQMAMMAMAAVDARGNNHHRRHLQLGRGETPRNRCVRIHGRVMRTLGGIVRHGGLARVKITLWNAFI